MGSVINLALGNLEIDWGKNHAFNDHSPLFQKTDVSKTPYIYAGGKMERRSGLAKPLREVTDRVELLGHTLAYAKREFTALAKFNDFDFKKFPFATLSKALTHLDVTKISPDYEGDYSFGRFFNNEIFDRIGLTHLVNDPRKVSYEISAAMENFSAHSILRILAENPRNLDIPVYWNYSDLIDGGWAKKKDFVKPLDPEHQFLIVTEGSSDASILKHALRLLKPHISDFFRFVDMEEGYPFSGTGNLFRFAQGLVSIGIRNNVIFLYDNDAEGVANYRRTSELNLPTNMSALKLPNLPAFQRFNTVGPTGRKKSNINGKAAAIECYLDLGASPVVRWTSYNKQAAQYHGELQNKSYFAQSFLSKETLSRNYDTTKILVLLDLIISTAKKMREKMNSDGLRRSV